MESTNRLRYLIAGTGGVGGSIAGFLSLAGKDVTSASNTTRRAQIEIRFER